MDSPSELEELQRAVAELRARRRELQDALASVQRRSQQLERIIEVVPGAVWQSEGMPSTPSYRMPYVSGEVERIFGYTRNECLSRPNFWNSITHPGDIPTVIRELAVVAQRGGRISPIRLVKKDGRAVWVDTYITIYHDELGQPSSRTVVASDVTARVQSEQESAELLAQTQELAERLENLIASVPGLVWEVAAKSESAPARLSFLSDYLTTLLGYRPEELGDDLRLWEELTHPEDRERVRSEQQAIVRRGSGTIQCRWLTKDGRTVWVETEVRMTTDDSGASLGACCVSMDVTARKRAQSERAQLKDQMIAAQKALLSDLATPTIPLSEQVLVMPLIGTIDAPRAARVVAALLAGIEKFRPQAAILDVTGARSIGAAAATALSQAAQGARLLGVEVVLTGLGSEAAATLAALDLDAGLYALTTCATLESGIAYAMRRR